MGKLGETRCLWDLGRLIIKVELRRGEWTSGAPNHKSNQGNYGTGPGTSPISTCSRLIGDNFIAA